MAPFDVCQNANAASRRAIPYLLAVQANLFDEPASRVVVPLCRATPRRLVPGGWVPRFEVAGVSVLMSSPELTGVPLDALGERVGSLADNCGEIVAALDLLSSGVCEPRW